MAKTSGGTRNYRPGTSPHMKRFAEYKAELATGKYDEKRSIFFDGGGYFLTEKGTTTHSQDEIDAARHMARKGYRMTLCDETPKGDGIKINDGKVYQATYEQRTPTESDISTVRNALYHARKKGADCALIYSKNHILSKETIAEGIKAYEEKNGYRLKRIYVVADNGHVHVWKHDTT